jgi:hypothetical protein
MAFKRFTKTGRVYTPIVSIWQRGQIGFNRGAVEKFKVNDYSFAVLFFDEGERKIGIRFTNDSTEKGICKITKGKTSSFISAKPFLTYYDIPLNTTVRFSMQYDEGTELYIIDINKPIKSVDSSDDG